jgi:TATA-binding protein-associated factor
MEEMFQPILAHYIASTSMLQKFLAAVIAEEWAREHDSRALPSATPLVEKSHLAQEVSAKTLKWLQSDPPPAYHEMFFTLGRIHTDCVSLLQSFAHDCKVPISMIPFLPKDIDTEGNKSGCFTIDTAQQSVGPMFSKLKEGLGRTKKREVAVLVEKRVKIVASIERYIELKGQHDTRVSAAFAAAFVAFGSTPDKVSPVVKGIMNGIKVSVGN